MDDAGPSAGNNANLTIPDASEPSRQRVAPTRSGDPEPAAPIAANVHVPPDRSAPSGWWRSGGQWWRFGHDCPAGRVDSGDIGRDDDTDGQPGS